MKLSKYIYLNTITFILTLIINPTIAQINADGIPFITNYSAKKYLAGESNWAIAQDNRGVMYFGNSKIILEYDGKNWTKIKVPKQEFIYSLATGSDGKIYVGGVDDFGVLEADNYGEKTFKSLSHLINDTIKISKVWKTYTSESFIYFCTFKYIFKYNNLTKQIKSIYLNKNNNFFSFIVNKTIFIGNWDYGLLQIVDDKVIPAKGGTFYKGKDIFSIINYEQNTLLIATNDGLSLYNNKSGEITPFSKNITSKQTNEILKKASIYSSVKISPTQFAYGTIHDGIFIINKHGEIIMHLNQETGMQDKTITDLLYTPNNDGILWTSLINGITSINLESPLRKYADESGLNGLLYGFTKHKSDYYVASMLGVYKMTEDSQRKIIFKSVEGISNEIIYSLVNFKTKSGDEILLAASTKDIYKINGHKAIPLNINIETNLLVPSKVQPNTLYAGTPRGIKRIRYKNKKFTQEKDFIGLPKQSVTRIIEDPKGNLWCNTLSEKQLISSTGEIIKLNDSIKNQEGLFFRFNNDIYISTNGLIKKYNNAQQKFETSKPLNKLYYKQNRKINDFFQLNDSMALTYYSENNKHFAEIITQKKEKWHNDTLSLRLLPSMTISTAYYDYPYVFIGGQEVLFILNLTRKKNFQNHYRTLLRNISIVNDSIIFKGDNNKVTKSYHAHTHTYTFNPTIDYKLNNITFDYSASFYEQEQDIKFSSKLEGFDNHWSAYTNDLRRTYTNLKEGTYKFNVKAKNIYNIESETAIFEFTIDPPWYKTWWAYLIYIIIALFILRTAVTLYTRKLQEDKKRLERIVEERTAEIVEKNKRIEKQNESITDSIRYAKRIQNAVLPNKQTSNLFDYFIYFKPKDIVSGDFYWIYHFEKEERLIAVAADCTGHGVPGAFMSMLGTSFLNEIIAKLDVSHSDIILNQLRENVIKTLSQGTQESDYKEKQKDGMDMGLASIDLKTMNLEFSGANNPLIFIRNNELIEYKPDKMPIGSYIKQDQPFNRTEIKLLPGDTFYMFSDGYVDQFGGEKGRKYMKKRFKAFLLSIHQQEMNKQETLLYEEMSQWMKKYEQVDDQIVIGMRVKP